MLKKYIFILFLPLSCLSQNIEFDSKLIESSRNQTKTQYYDETRGNNNTLMKAKQNIFAKYNPLSLVLRSSMLFYQHSISPQLISNCQYELTCSNFSKKVIVEYGFIKGLFLTADRLMRDNPSSISEYKYFNISENNRALDKVVYYRIR